MVVLLVIYKPLYWPIARWRFPIATCCTDHVVNVCTSNCSITNHMFFMHLSLDQFLFSWLPLKAALTDIDYVFVVLRPECNSINIVYCSVHWGSFHTILDNWAAGTKTGAPDRALLFTNRIGDFTGISATEINLYLVDQPRGLWVFSKLQGLQYYFPEMLDAIYRFTNVRTFLTPISITFLNPKILGFLLLRRTALLGEFNVKN